MNKTEKQGVNVKLTRNCTGCKVEIDGVMVERVKGVKINHNVDENGGVPSISITVVPKKLTVEGDGFDCHTSTTTKETAVRKTLIDRDLDEILSLIGGVPSEKKNFRDNLLDHIYLTSELHIKAVLSTVHSIVSSGFSYKNSVYLLTQIEKLYLGTGWTSLDDCVNSVLSIVNAYGGLEDSGVYCAVNEIVGVAADGVVDIDELLSGLPTLIPVASAAGVGFREILNRIESRVSFGDSTSMAMIAVGLKIIADSSKEDSKNSGFSGFARLCFSWLKKPFGGVD